MYFNAALILVGVISIIINLFAKTKINKLKKDNGELNNKLIQVNKEIVLLNDYKDRIDKLSQSLQLKDIEILKLQTTFGKNKDIVVKTNQVEAHMTDKGDFVYESKN